MRGRAITDTLTELLVDTVHRIGTKADRRVSEALLDDLKRVTGKTNLLFALADASSTTPDGLVRDVVFPVVGEQTLRDLVKEWKATGPVFYNTLRDSIRSSYRSHYRQMLPALKALEFRSNNAMYQPIIQGLETVKRYADTKLRYYPSDEQIPLDFVPPLWRDEVVEQDANGNQRVNRITYEITVLDALRDQVRCKEVWIVGADRYRNPDDDVPADFELRREEHYAALKLPLDPDTFIESIRTELDGALRMFNDGVPTNAAVKLTDKAGGWIGLSPLEPQPQPQNVAALKAEIGRDWPMTSLLDILKETDFRLNFTDAFRSVTSHENLERERLRPRLLLCVHGIGTNTGLQHFIFLELLEFNGEPDHVHLLLSVNPKVAPSVLVNNFKTVSSRLIRKEFAMQVGRVYRKPVFWSRSYCVVSCGGAPLSVLKQYVEGQAGVEDGAA